MIIKSQIKAIIFDYDGVLGDSDSFNSYACKESAKRCGIDLEESVYRKCAPGGATIKDIATCIVTHYDKPNMVDQFLQSKRSFDNDYINEVKILAHTESTIVNLHNIYPLAINTGTRSVLVRGFLSKYGLDKYFQTIVSAEDIKHGKPDPESYLLACNKLGIAPEYALVVEDGVSGVVAAKKAGCYVVGISSSIHSSKLRELGCDEIISNLSELMVPSEA